MSMSQPSVPESVSVVVAPPPVPKRILAISFGVTLAMLLAVAVALFATPAIAATSYSITSTSPGVKDWNTPSTWTPNGIPGSAPGDTVTISTSNAQIQLTTSLANPLAAFTLAGTNSYVEVAGGNLSLGGNSSVGSNASLKLSAGGTVTITADLQIGAGGTLESNNGTIDGAGNGTLTIVAGAGAANFNVNGLTTLTGGLTVFNAGNINQNAASSGLALNSGAVIENQGLGAIYLNTAAGITSDLVASSLALNGGNLQKSGGGTSTIDVPVTTSATATVTTSNGVVLLNQGGTHTGTFAANTAGARVSLSGSHSVSGGSWTTGASNAGVAIIGGQTTLSSTINGVNLYLEGGTVAGNGTLTLSGILDWNGGSIIGSGGGVISAINVTIDGTSGTMALQNYTVDANGASSYGGAGVGALTIGTNGLLNLDSTFSYSSGTQPMTIGSGGALWVNSGSTFQILDDGAINGTGLFKNNSGSVVKQGGSGVTTINPVFDNTSGTVSVNTSGLTLRLAGGGTHFGNFDTPVTSTTIDFAGGTHTINAPSTLGGLGKYLVSGGTLDVDQAQSFASSLGFAISGGVLTGSQPLQFDGGFLWSGGTIDDSSGAGLITLNSSTASITGASGAMVLDGRTINNTSQLFYSPSGTNYLAINSGGVLNNVGTFTLTTDAPINSDLLSSPALTNSSVMTKSGGSTVANIYPPFAGGGTINVNSGSIALHGGGTLTGSLNVPTAANKLIVADNTLNVSGPPSFTGSGYLAVDGVNAFLNFATVTSLPNLEVSYGTAAGSNFTVTNALVWNGGVIAGPGTTTLAATATATANLIRNATLNTRTFENNNVFNYTPNTFDLFFASGTFNNNNGASFNILGDRSIAGGGGTNAFNNATGATVSKTGGTAGTTIGVPFHNNGGTVASNVANGTIIFAVGGSMNGGLLTTVANANIHFTNGTFAWSGGTWGGSGMYELFAPAQVNVTNSLSILPTLRITGGTLDVASLKVLAIDTLDWDGGTIQGGGQTRVTTLGTIDNIAPTTLAAGTLTFDTVLYYDADTVNYLTANGNILGGVSSTFDIRDNGLLTGTGFLTTQGTFTKSGSGGTSTIDNPISSSGTAFDVSSGALVLKGGGVISAASVTIDAATVLDVDGTANLLQINAPATVSGTGAWQLSSGTLDVNVPATFQTYVMNGGTLSGSGNIAVKGGSWLAGTIGSGGGTFSIDSGATFDLTGVPTKTIARNVSNLGTVNLSASAAVLAFQNAVTWTNDGAFYITSDGDFTSSIPPSTFAISSTGTLGKSGGGVADIATIVNNDGLVDLASGAGNLHLSGGGTHTGDFTVANPSLLMFAAGANSFSAASSITGGGTVTFAGTSATVNGPITMTGTAAILQFFSGTTTVNAAASTPILSMRGNVSGSGTIAIDGNGFIPSTWSAGTMGGTGAFTIAGAATLNITGSNGQMVLDQRTLTNNGTINYTSATNNLALDSTAILQNNGSFNLKVDNDITEGFNGGTIQNAGTFNRNTTTGNATIAPDFVNSGVSALVSLQTGTTTFNSYTQTGSTLALDGGDMASPATVMISGGDVVGDGAINAAVNNAGIFAPGNGTATGTISTGQFTQTSAGTVHIEIGGTTPGTAYDVVATTGQPVLDGTLQAVLINSFIPSNGNTFDVLTYSTPPSTDFSTYDLPTFGSGSFNKSFTPTALQLVATAPTPDVSISQTTSGPGYNGNNHVFTITLTNNDSIDSATGVTLTNNLSGPAAFVSSSTTVGSCTGLSCTIGTLAPGASAVVTLTVSATGSGTITNSASSTANEPDSNTANNTNVVASITVSPRAEGSLSTAESSDPVDAATNVTYTITVVNGGPDNAASANVALVASGGSIVSASSANFTCSGTGGSASCTNASLPTGVFTVTVVVQAGAQGTVSLAATLTSTTFDSNTSDNTQTEFTSITPIADMSIAKTGPASATAGANVTYTIVVTNNGPSDAANVTVDDPAPAGLTFVSNSGACTGTFPCNIGTLNSGQSATITTTFSVPANASGSINNTATVATSTNDPTSTNDSSTINTPVTGSSDLAVTKNGPASVTAGGQAVYTIVVTNNGPSDASVTVADTTPPALTFVSNSGGCTSAYPCTLALLSGQSATITSTYNVSASASGTITNNATVSSTNSDGNPANDTASVTTPVAQAADLSITKSGPTSATAGAPVVYTIVVTNNGPSNASGITVSDPTPTNATFVSNSGACTTAFPCSIASLANGASATITSTFSVASGATGSLSNTSTVSSSNDANTANNSATTSATITSSADLSITKSGPASVIAGGQAVYTIVVTNNGPSNASGVTVSDATPAQTTFVSNSGACTSVFPCSLGTIAAGSSVTITSTYNVAANATGSISNTASVTSSTADPSTANNSATTTATVSGNADLSIVKSGPTSVVAGANVTYTITVTNNGPSSATGVTVSDNTPPQTTFVSNSGACTTPFPCTIGTLNTGQSATVTATFLVASSASGSISNTASVAAGTTDPSAGNNSSTVVSTITNQSDLSISKSGPATVNAGTNITYTMLIVNNGPSSASGITVTDPTPAQTTFVSNSGGCTTAFPCSLPPLGAGGSISITSTYAVAANASGSISNTATVSSSGTDPNAANNSATTTATVSGQADLSVTKSGPASAAAGTNVTYTITVTNSGPANAGGVVLNDPTPAGTTFVSNSGACTTAFPCNLGTLNSGQSVTVNATFAVDPTASGSVTNAASVTSATADPNGTNNSASAVTTLTQSAALSITKTGPASATPGSNVVYTITVNNGGPSAANDVTVTDPTPAGFTFISTTCGNGAFPCALGTVMPGQPVTFTVTFSVNNNAFGPITNTAIVDTTTNDSTAGDNSSSVTTTISATADLSITKSGPASVTPGSNAVYTITVTNNGPAPATGVTVNDPTPAQTTFVSNSGACTTAFPCSLGTLSSGQSATITTTFAVASNASGTISNTATVSSSTSDPNSGNNSATTTAPVGTVPFADVSISKSGPLVAQPNTQIEYTITVTNNGPNLANSVTVSDPTPARLTFVSNSGGCTTAYPCSLGTMAPGQTITILSRYNVLPGDGPFTNNAFVSSALDPINSNNASSWTTQTDCPSDPIVVFNPADGATNVPTSGRLSWNEVGAASYSIYLAPKSAGGCNVPYASSSASFLEYTGLQPNTLYEWKVIAQMPGCPERVSACVTFTTGANCNAQPPALLRPQASSTTSSPITFEWTGVTRATSYTVFANNHEIGSTASTSLVATIDSDGPVTWYVVATIPGCGSVQSPSSTFGLCNRPGIPLARVIGQATSGQNYHVEWDEVPNATRYEVQQADNPDFNNAETISTDKLFEQFRHETDDEPVAFYYRVRAFSACTPNGGDFSPVIRVVIIPLPPIDEPNPSSNVPVGSTQVVIKQVFIPGEPNVTLVYTAATDRPWLEVRPNAGLLPPEGVTLEVLADPTNLPNGTFTATVIVTVTDNSSAKVGTNATTAKKVPVSISLVTPITPKDTPAIPTADSLIIPTVGHLDGINSSWQSDIRVTNTSDKPARYELTFTPSVGSEAGIKQTKIDVEAGATTALDDIVRNWYGIGSLGDSANGMLEIKPIDGALLSHTVASSRTYNVTNNGTLGQYIPALPFAGFIGKSLAGALPQVMSLQQIAQSSAFRTNVGVLEASGNPASIVLSVFNAAGTNVKDIALELKGGEQRQLNSLLATHGITLDNGRIEVKVTDGIGKVSAYASVVDNATLDPLLVSGVKLGAQMSSRYVLPGVADFNTGIANWRTDMRVFNSALTSTTAKLTMYPIGGAPISANVSMAPGEIRTLDDIVKSLFKASNIGGAVHVETDTPSSLVVTGRTYNQTEKGTFGQFIPAVTVEEAVGRFDRALHILQVEDSSRYRTNIGIAEVTGRPVRVEVMVYLPDSKVTPFIEVPLEANEFRQLSVIRDMNLGDVYNARVVVRVIDGNGKIAAYGSVVDMKTQDPTYVPAQ